MIAKIPVFQSSSLDFHGWAVWAPGSKVTVTSSQGLRFNARINIRPRVTFRELRVDIFIPCYAFKKIIIILIVWLLPWYVTFGLKFWVKLWRGKSRIEIYVQFWCKSGGSKWYNRWTQRFNQKFQPKKRRGWKTLANLLPVNNVWKLWTRGRKELRVKSRCLYELDLMV